MRAVWRRINRLLRGPEMSGLLLWFGIDPIRYWLLIDLFGELSDRRELFSQLGTNRMTLQKAAWLYYILSGLMVALFIATKMPLATYSIVFLGMTAFLLLSMLLPETSNSLVNPVEGLVLAHQPIDGGTYTAAKLTHLLRILLHFVPGLNLIPALAALALKGCPWYYPLLHLLAAFLVGLVVALFCCALFGWLIRFVPPARLKAVGFIAEMSPWLAFVLMQFSGEIRKHIHIAYRLPAGTETREVLAAAVFLVSASAVIFGIRALSGDYLARVAAIARGGSSGRRGTRPSRLASLVDRWFGGPPARAGFDYVSKMMARDWQFRRQMLQLIPITLMFVIGLREGIRVSPFSGRFTALHILPHVFGFAFYMVCSVMVFGNDHKGTWLFLLAPAGALRGFARGIYARLLTLIVVPHLVLVVVLAWYWGVRDAALFVAYSTAAAAVYLSLELQLIEGIPFSKQPETTQNPYAIPIMLLGGGAIAVAVGLQYFLLFHSHAAVVGATLALALTASLVTRGSLGALETSMRFHLGLLSNETKAIYTEIQA